MSPEKRQKNYRNLLKKNTEFCLKKGVAGGSDCTHTTLLLYTKTLNVLLFVACILMSTPGGGHPPPGVDIL